jgi:hypothetical protein
MQLQKRAEQFIESKGNNYKRKIYYMIYKDIIINLIKKNN